MLYVSSCLDTRSRVSIGFVWPYVCVTLCENHSNDPAVAPITSPALGILMQYTMQEKVLTNNKKVPLPLEVGLVVLMLDV